MIVLIDNYDSFSYNLYQLIGSLTPDIRVIRNDSHTIEEILTMKPDKIVISPGPGRPEQAGIIVPLIQSLAGRIPILGVCLGHQAICHAFGGIVTYAPELMHGKQSSVTVDRGDKLFSGLPESIPVARYHSLIADPESLPDCLKVTARTEKGEIMAVSHKTLPVYGLQFHPESILTPDGEALLKNFLFD